MPQKRAYDMMEFTELKNAGEKLEPGYSFTFALTLTSDL